MAAGRPAAPSACGSTTAPACGRGVDQVLDYGLVKAAGGQWLHGDALAPFLEYFTHRNLKEVCNVPSQHPLPVL